MKYSWSEYYRKAYEGQRKKNTDLAGKVVDAEGKQKELQEKYASICANPLYRMSKIPGFLGRGWGKLKRAVCSLQDSGKEKCASGQLLTDYKERLRYQGDRYEQWIKEKEPVLWERYRDVLASGENMKPRRCRVIPYRMLSGIKDITGITEDADILLLADCPEELDEQAVNYVERWFGTYPDTKMLYGAEDHVSDGKRCLPWFKPCWSPDTLLGYFYFGSYVALDAAWAKKMSLSGYTNARLNLYDFLLRLLRPCFEKPNATVYNKDMIPQAAFYYGSEKAPISGNMCSPGIVCLELVLYHRCIGEEPGMPAESETYQSAGDMGKNTLSEFWGYEKEFTKLKQDFINRLNHRCFLYQTCHPDVWSVVPEYEDVGRENAFFVSVVILSKDHPELLQNCIGSFLERTVLPELRSRVEFIIVDNGSSVENCQTIRNFLTSLKTETHYIYHPAEFNFSAMCNMGVREAKGEYLLLMNDDVEIIEENWLRIMLGQAMLPGIGAVGAKLWYPGEERIQHAGITNMHVGPSHKLTTFPDDRNYYYGHNTITHDMIAVTGACLLVKKTLYEETGGLDEEMAVAYNDVDFCFKLVRAGYRNVIRNDAVLLHHESASRGLDDLSEEKWRRLIEERTKLYKKHPLFYGLDPYYSEQLAGDTSDYRIGYQYPYERRFLTELPVKKRTKKDLEKVFSTAVMLTVDRIGKQRKTGLEDILEAEGWCYMQGWDNCMFERWLVLEAESDDFYYQIPVKERIRPDVKAVLPQQKNVELSGFVCRVLKKDIVSGHYAVGMLYKNLCSGQIFYNRSDRRIEIF